MWISEEEINSMKDSNDTTWFMDVMRWYLSRFDDGKTDPALGIVAIDQFLTEHGFGLDLPSSRSYLV